MLAPEICKDILQFRHACKSFDAQKKINAADFDLILEAGRMAPSSFGFEPWHFLVIQDPKLREKMKSFTWGGQKQLDTCSHFVIFLVKNADFFLNPQQLSQFMTEVQNIPAQGQKMRQDFFKNFLDKDFVLDSREKITDWATHQVYLAFGNMMNFAAMREIDSCPIEGFDKKAMSDFIQHELSIAPEIGTPVACCAFGFREQNPTRAKTRRSIEEVVKWF